MEKNAKQAGPSGLIQEDAPGFPNYPLSLSCPLVSQSANSNRSNAEEVAFLSGGATQDPTGRHEFEIFLEKEFSPRISISGPCGRPEETAAVQSNRRKSMRYHRLVWFPQGMVSENIH